MRARQAGSKGEPGEGLSSDPRGLSPRPRCRALGRWLLSPSGVVPYAAKTYFQSQSVQTWVGPVGRGARGINLSPVTNAQHPRVVY